ncbi:MAG: hypothetical protein AB8H86_24455 [Polyangiales bacterium]
MSRTIALPQRSTTQRLLVVVIEDVRLDRSNPWHTDATILVEGESVARAGVGTG